MKTFLVLVIVVAAAALLFPWMRNRLGEGKGRKSNRKRTTAQTTHLVQLRAGPGACSLARQQAGSVYETADQPRLPLPGCRADRCLCRFDGIVERRKRARREHGDRRETVRFGEAVSDRRSRGDRRSVSRDPWSTGI